jgi:hypothetical protein
MAIRSPKAAVTFAEVTAAVALTSMRTSVFCPETLMLVTAGGASVLVGVCADATCANSSKAPSCLALIIILAFFGSALVA